MAKEGGFKMFDSLALKNLIDSFNLLGKKTANARLEILFHYKIYDDNEKAAIIGCLISYCGKSFIIERHKSNDYLIKEIQLFS